MATWADKDKIKTACDIVGCKMKDLLASRLTEVAVVLIVGPVGFKYIVPFADLETPAPVTTEVEGEEAPVSASPPVRKRRRRPAKKS